LDALNRERTFKAVGTACRALYATECLQPVDVAQQLMFVNTILRRDMKGINQLYPQYHSVADELALSLPHLMPPTYLASISVVERLLWMNYWHPDTAAFYGFPDPEKDARLLPLAEQLPNGAWFFKLTEDPLDITRADHREALVWAYQRFQPVGQPVEPSQMNAQAQQNKTFSAEQFRELTRKSGENLDPAAQKQIETQTEQFLALVEAIKAKVQKNNPQ